MICRKLFLAGAILSVLSGCQTTSIDNIALPKSTHISHDTYEVERQSAQVLRDEAQKLAIGMRSYCNGEISRSALQGSWLKTMSA